MSPFSFDSLFVVVFVCLSLFCHSLPASGSVTLCASHFLNGFLSLYFYIFLFLFVFVSLVLSCFVSIYLPVLFLYVSFSLCASLPPCVSPNLSLYIFLSLSLGFSLLCLSLWLSVCVCLSLSLCLFLFFSVSLFSVFLCLSLPVSLSPYNFFQPVSLSFSVFQLFFFFFILKVLAQNGFGQAFLISCRFKGSICKSSGVCLCICEPKFLIWLNNQINYLKRKKSCVVKNLRNLNKTLHEFYYKMPRGFIAVLSKSSTLNVARFFKIKFFNCFQTMFSVWISGSCTEIKIKLNFFFYTSLRSDYGQILNKRCILRYSA